jgi:hypothetical protein
MTIVTAGSGLKAGLVVGLAMAQANIGSAMRQASPLLDLEIVAPFAFA